MARNQQIIKKMLKLASHKKLPNNMASKDMSHQVMAYEQAIS